MSLLTAIRQPGHGRRQADPAARLAAEVQRLQAGHATAAARLAEVERKLAESERANRAMAHDLTQSAIREVDKDRRLAAADQLLKSWAGKVVRAEAEHRRLRQAVINARPRITFAPPPLVPPYAALSLPYPVPVQGPDSSAEVTQKIPILDLPVTS